MTKKTINTIIIVIFIAVVIIGAFLMFNKASAPTNGIILYYGEQCPHCIKVEEFIKNNNLESKIQITKKEVWHNQTNAAEMIGKIKSCGLDANSAGVPFLYEGGKCYIGDGDIINYFAEKL